MKKILRIFYTITIIFTLSFILFLTYVTVTDYKPKPVENISVSKGNVISIYDTLNIFNWNIGYCGLSDDMSFFYDGGDKVRTSKKITLKNIQKIKKQILSHDSIDFYLLQEVDIKSKRSYKTNQYDSLLLENHHGSFAQNYKVAFVPVPIGNPMGKVDGGLMSFSKYEPFNVNRLSFPGNYAWPKGLFLLDRCFMVQRFYTSNGKELLIINTHNSAYDDGTLRTQQMEVMKSFLVDEYEKGNYIIVGGDWNQNPPKQGEITKKKKEGQLIRMRIDYKFMPNGWSWEFCEKIPTNRMINEAYIPNKTTTTTIDYFLLSPNTQMINLKNIDLQFKNSDHQPVLISFILL